MKRIDPQIGTVILALLCSLAIGLMVTEGCKSPESTAYKATGTVIITVDNAMQAWGDYVRTGVASVEQQQQVKDVYDKYYQSVMIERDAVISYKTNPDTNALLRVVGAVSASSADVIGLIIKFLPPPAVAKLKGG